MATLILEYEGRRRGAVLNGRTVIGRGANSHVVITDRSVSRVHAWIGKVGHTFFVADSGSRSGTRVNGRPVEGRRSLRDGDQILIGPAKITFHADAPLPPDVEPLREPAPAQSASDDGIFIYCECGAPIWAPREFGGRMGRCRHCGEKIELPRKPGGAAASDPNNETMGGGMPSPFAREQAGSVRLTPEVASARGKPGSLPPKGGTGSISKGVRKPSPAQRVAEADEPPRTETICGACQSPISMLERTTTCPDCGVAFHADCWTDNRGCSSYGCKHVGILDPKPAASDQAVYAGVASAEHEGSAPADESPPESRAVPWGYILLPASALAGLAGVFAFGVPSLAIAIGLVGWSVRRPPKDRTLFAAATIVSIVAGAAGAGFSTYWWLHP